MSEEVTVEKPVRERHRKLSGVTRIVALCLSVTSIGAAIYYIFGITIAGLVFVDTGYYFFLNALLLPLVYFYFPMTQKAARDRVPWYDWGAAILSFGTAFFFFIYAFDILLKGWEVAPPETAWAFAVVLFFLSLEAARRTGGWGLFFVVIFFTFLPLYQYQL